MRHKAIYLLVLFSIPCQVYSQNSVIDSLENILKTGSRNEEYNRALNALATEYTRKDMSISKIYLCESIQLAKELKNPVLLSYAYSQMVTVQVNSGNSDSAAYYLSLLKYLINDNVPENAKANYNFAAGLYYKKMGNYKEALPYMINSLQQYITFDKKKSTIGSRTSIAGQNLNIGNNLMAMGEYKKALQYHLTGLKIFEEVDNKRGISLCYESICDDFIRLNQFNEAIPYAKKSIDLKTVLNDKRGIATTQAEYGAIYKGLQDYDRSIAYYNDAAKTFREMKLSLEEANANLELGKVYAIKNNNLLAIKYFELAKEQAIHSKDSSLFITADASIVSVKNSTAKNENAEQKLLVNLENAIQMGDKSKELSSYESLADYYSNNKQFDKALLYTKKLYDSTHNLQNQDIQYQVKRMEEQYNLEKKENEIVLLKKDQELNRLTLQKQRTLKTGAVILLGMVLLIAFLIINRYRIVHNSRRIIEMERIRNDIARDLHDDIGSTLTSINIISKMALEQAEGNGEMITAPSLLKIKDRSSAIMESVSDIVWAINPQNDTLEKIIFRMKEFAAEILDPLKINYTFIEEGNLTIIKPDIKKRKDFYLLFKEAVNNAAKYSDCKNMIISLKQNQQVLKLKITDDGIGFDPEKGKYGNGLTNMRERAAAMQADFQLITAPGKGTEIRVDIPIT
ncbi:MAG: hypothetical protein JST58_18520 [Bacteroidetes bacterium]|nr:hypothetical protein [Bacteroidota bacterium]